jgi:hypothetical protein
LAPRGNGVDRAIIDRHANETRARERCLFCKQLKDQIGQFLYDNEIGLLGWICDDCIQSALEMEASQEYRDEIEGTI